VVVDVDIWLQVVLMLPSSLGLFLCTGSVAPGGN